MIDEERIVSYISFKWSFVNDLKGYHIKAFQFLGIVTSGKRNEFFFFIKNVGEYRK